MSIIQPTFIKRLVIADDDHDDQILLRETMEDFQNPPQISMVSNGCQLIDELLKDDSLPDLVLLDLNMPNKNGIECLLEIRSNPQYESLPVVVLSTSKDPHDIEACFNSGATLFFSKPYTFKELKTLVHTLLGTNWTSIFDRKLNKEEFLAIALKGQMPVVNSPVGRFL